MRNVRNWFDSSVGETGGNPIRITVSDDILRIGDVTVKRRQPDRIVSTTLRNVMNYSPLLNFLLLKRG